MEETARPEETEERGGKDKGRRGQLGDQKEEGGQGKRKKGGRNRVKKDGTKKKTESTYVNKVGKLTCYYTNADGLLNKRSEFSAALALYAPDVICITEVVPKNLHTPAQEAEFQVEGYDLCTNLAQHKRGVIIYTSAHLQAAPFESPVTTGFDESCWVEVKLKDKDKLLIGCVYRSPNGDIVNNAKLMSSLKSICARKEFTHVLICGDFNIPDIDWVEDMAPQNVNSLGFQFMECVRDCFLTQHVKEPTHRRAEQTANILDLVFSNEEGMVEDLTLEAPIGMSHHCAIIFNFMCYTCKSRSSVRKPQFNKGDYVKLRANMASYDWKNDLEGKSCENSWKMFEERMKKEVEECIPMRRCRSIKPGRPLWMNEKALIKVKKKSEAYKRYINTSEGRDYVAYAQARNQARWECRRLKREFERSLAKDAKTNPKSFYKYANSKLKTRSGIGNLDTANGKVSSDKDKAQALNEFFTSVFTREDTSSIPDPKLEHAIKVPLEDLHITADDVKKKLDKLNPNKSPGPHEMHP